MRKLALFKKKVRSIEAVTKETVEALWESAGAVGGSASMDVADKFKIKHPQFSRDTGAGILDYVLTAEKPQVRLDVEFAADSLFCEWAYVLDLDKEILEVYKGFNKTPVPKSQRFAKAALIKPAHCGTQYHPVKLLKKFKFDKLTSETMKKLEKKLNQEDAA